jgi:Flp pilus assembly protein TadD
LLTLLVAAATLLVHRPVLSVRAESFDDEEAIVRNRLIQNPGMESVRRFFGEVLESSVVKGYYRPMTLTSLMIDWAMGARPHEPRVFRRTSLALHLAATVLIVLLCYQFFSNPWIAATAGLLFGLHPLSVEPIAWIMERKTLLAAGFSFAALNAYVRYCRTNGKAWYVAAILMFLGALLSKPTATPLPLMMLLIDYWPLKRFSRRTVIEKLPFFALAILFAVLACICEQRVNPLTLPAKLSPFHLPLRLCWLTVFYPCKVLLPINLSSVYMLPDPLTLANPIVIAAAIAALLLAAAVVWSARKTPAIWVGSAIFYLGLAPTMGFVGYSWVSASDKYTYLPAVGLVLILCWIIEQVTTAGAPLQLRSRRVATAAVILLAAVLLAAGTRLYLNQWRTTSAFLAYMLDLAPNSHYLHCQLGAYHLARDEYDQSIREYDTALSLQATNPDALNNRGSAHLAKRQYKEAIADFSRAIELKPRDADLYYNRGKTLAEMGALNEAIRDYDEAIRLNPAYVSAYNNRGVAFVTLGRYDQALRDHSQAIELDRGQADLYNNRAVDYYYLKQIDKAWADVAQCRRLGGTPTPALISLLEKAAGRQP